MKLHLLPTRTAGAAENMALDFLLLQRSSEPAALRFRHYEWRGPACTFGFSQKIEFVRANLPGPEKFDLCRRPTGGGIVDHRHDWTYSLVIPRGHPLFDERATQSYQAVHECLAKALAAVGQPAELKRADDPAEVAGGGLGPGVCFQRAEIYDVINSRTGAKIAGAAQKRNKRGLLLQGSVEKESIGLVDWDEFAAGFPTKLAEKLGVEAGESSWPELDDDEVSALIEQYSSPEWLEYR